MTQDDKLTLVYTASRSFLRYLRVSVASVPNTIHIIVTLVGDEKESLNDFPRNVEWVHLRETERFKKSEALNAALACVYSPWVMIADADMIFPDLLFSSLDLRFRVNNVYRFFVARYNAEKTARIFAGQDPWNIALYSGKPTYEASDVIEIYASNNPCVYDMSFLRELGCFDQKFNKWGGEDEELTYRGLARGAQERRLPIIVGHLHHERFQDFNVPWKH